MIKKLSIALIAPLVLVAYASASKKIVVDLSTQTATAYENGSVAFRGRISTGTAKRPTPAGHFRVLEKDIDHVSNAWPKPNGGAKMHYMLRLTRYGIAMHLGYVPNYPASHGCIRLQNGFAQRMYSWARVGTPVHVRGHAPARVYRPTKVYRPVVAKRRPTYSPRPVRKATVSKYTKKAGYTPQKKVTTLDVMSSSPKAAARVKAATKKNWNKNRKKRRSPRVDPLKAIRA